MSKLIFTSVFWLLFSVKGLFGTAGFTINGTIEKLPDNSIIKLYDMQSGNLVDSAVVKNNRFFLKGVSDETAKPYAIHLANPQMSHFVFLYFGNETLNISGSIDDLPDKLNITGSNYNNIKTALDKKTALLEELKAKRSNEIQALYKEGKWNDSIKEAYVGRNGIMKRIDDDIKTVEKLYIKENSNNYYTLYLLNLYKTNHYADDELLEVYSSLSSKMKETRDAKAIKTHLESPKLKKGDKYLNATALDRAGAAVRFSKFFDGRHVLLNFSSAGCQNSVDALPMLIDIHNNMSDKVNIVTYCVDSSKENFEAFSNTSYHPWPFIWNPEGSFSETYLKYRIGGTTTFFLFDEEGRLIESWMGYDNTTFAKITELLKN